MLDAKFAHPQPIVFTGAKEIPPLYILLLPTVLMPQLYFSKTHRFNILLPNHNIKRTKKVLKKTLKSTAQKSSGWAGALYPFFMIRGQGL